MPKGKVGEIPDKTSPLHVTDFQLKWLFLFKPKYCLELCGYWRHIPHSFCAYSLLSSVMNWNKNPRKHAAQLFVDSVLLLLNFCFGGGGVDVSGYMLSILQRQHTNFFNEICSHARFVCHVVGWRKWRPEAQCERKPVTRRWILVSWSGNTHCCHTKRHCVCYFKIQGCSLMIRVCCWRFRLFHRTRIPPPPIFTLGKCLPLCSHEIMTTPLYFPALMEVLLACGQSITMQIPRDKPMFRWRSFPPPGGGSGMGRPLLPRMLGRPSLDTLSSRPKRARSPSTRWGRSYWPSLLAGAMHKEDMYPWKGIKQKPSSDKEVGKTTFLPWG